MNKKKNENSSNKLNMKQKKISKNEINTKIKYDNDEGNNIIENILKRNKIKSKAVKTNEDFQENINKENEDKIKLLFSEYEQPGDFKFINIIKTVKKFSPSFLKSIEKRNNYKLIINIIVDDDSLNSTNNLLKIFKIIESSLNSLNEINITIDRILICVFFQHFTYESSFNYLFPGLKFYNYINQKPNLFHCSSGQYLSENKINILLIYKKASTFIEIYKFFYSNIMTCFMSNKSKEKNKTILIVNWPNGKIFSEINKNSEKKNGVWTWSQSKNILKNVFKICGNKNIILIPDINFVPHKEDKIFGLINKYSLDKDKIKINLYWNMISGFPIDHNFFFINMNYTLFSSLKKFYQKEINIFSNEYYHDYSLTIYLRQQMKNEIIYGISDVEIEYSDLPWNLMIFFHNLILRRGSENANFLNLMLYFFSCEKCSYKVIIEKIFIFFKLINNFLQFFWLGISFLISYALSNDTFGSEGNKMDYFCSLGYFIMNLILLAISSLYVRNNPIIKQSKKDRYIKLKSEGFSIILILYIVHYIYFFFFIICALIAIIHIKQGKYADIRDREYYVLNTNYVIILLFSNIAIYFLPSFFNFSNITSKGFLYYLLLFLPCAPTFFHFPSVFTFMKTINSKEKKSEAKYIILYVVLNGMLTVLCLVFDTTRQNRMNFLSVIVFVISLLNVIKLIVSIIGMCLIKRNKKIFEKYLEDNDNINLREDINFSEDKDDNKENNILTNTNLVINDNKLKEINEEKNKKSENEINTIKNKEFNDKAIEIEESKIPEKIKNINKQNFYEENIPQNVIDSTNFATIAQKIDKFPMDSIENNIETKPIETKIKKSFNNLKESLKPILQENNVLEENDKYPKDTTQSFSAQNSSIDISDGIINKKDLEENGA